MVDEMNNRKKDAFIKKIRLAFEAQNSSEAYGWYMAAHGLVKEEEYIALRSEAYTNRSKEKEDFEEKRETIEGYFRRGDIRSAEDFYERNPDLMGNYDFELRRKNHIEKRFENINRSLSEFSYKQAGEALNDLMPHLKPSECKNIERKYKEALNKAKQQETSAIENEKIALAREKKELEKEKEREAAREKKAVQKARDRFFTYCRNNELDKAEDFFNRKKKYFRDSSFSSLCNQYEKIKNDEKKKIEKIAHEKGIKKLVHFTQIENLSKIMRYGLIPRDELRKRKIDVAVNDDKRLDGFMDALCLSIEFPNHLLLYKFMNEKGFDKFVVLEIDSRVLHEKECAFCQDNAASYNVTSIDIAERKGPEGFMKMFERTEEKQTLSDFYTTDVQAEVLVFGIIEPSLIKAIHYRDSGTVDARVRNNIQVRISPELFKRR